MKHIIFQESSNNKYSTAILIKNAAFDSNALQRHYVNPLTQAGILKESIIAFTVKYDAVTKKAPVKLIKEYLSKLLPALDSLGVTSIYIADSAYFKVLIGKTKADTQLGYTLPCAIKGYTHINVVLGVNYQALVYNPVIHPKLDLSLATLSNCITGVAAILGAGIIHSAYYPKDLKDIAEALQSLHQYPSLTCDIETFSLKFNKAGIGTISFAWDKHNGISFPCDYFEFIIPLTSNKKVFYGEHWGNKPVKKLLKEFFTSYKGELTFHKATFDVKILIYELWMQDINDIRGLLTGLDIMCEHMHDTKIIAYLALNSTAGNTLGLKALAHEFAGNWAKEDIKDITRIPLAELLQYNLVDCLSTHFVRGKYEPLMEKDNQGELYRGLMLDSLKLLIQVELTGMPMSRSRIQHAKEVLKIKEARYLNTIRHNTTVLLLNKELQEHAMRAANTKLKVKQHPLSHFADVEFNPNSGVQLQKLLYGQMGLPVIDYTDAKQPATGAETLEKLIHHVKDPAYKDLLENIIAYSKVNTILTTFIPAFEGAISKDNNTTDIVWLFGSFNLGGTVSGRLSSSEPNLQNIPAGSEYGKLVKSCFVSPQGFLHCGADFNSLEDYISALTTKDPNKLAVYLGHTVYELKINEVCHEIRDDAIINFDGKQYTGDEFYATYSTL